MGIYNHGIPWEINSYNYNKMVNSFINGQSRYISFIDEYCLVGSKLGSLSTEYQGDITKYSLVGGIPTILKNDGVRQWEG